MATERLDIVVREDGARVVSRNIENVGRSALIADRGVASLRKGLAVVAGSVVLNQLRHLSDAFTQIQNRLRLTTTDQGNLNAVFDELVAVSLRTRSSLEANANLYSRVALATRNLGISQREVLTFTESLNQAIKISGATAAESAAGLIQLSQGLASGKLHGDELRSVLEQLPAVADVIAKGMGVTRGELRKLGADGEITAQKILEAFRMAREELNERFAKTVPTIAEGFVMLKNSAIVLVGAIDEAAGASSAFGTIMRDLALFMIGDGLKWLVDFTRALMGTLDPQDELTSSTKVFATVLLTVVGVLKLVAEVIINSVVNAFKLLGNLMGGMAAVVVAFVKTVATAVGEAGALLGKFGTAMELAAEGSMHGAIAIINEALTAPFTETEAAISETGTVIAEVMGDAFGTVTDNMMTNYQTMIDGTSEGINRIVDIWDQGARDIQDRSKLVRGAIDEEGGNATLPEIVDEKELARLRKLGNELDSLVGRIAPLTTAVKERAEAHALLDQALKDNIINDDELVYLTGRLEMYYEDLLDPLGKLNREMDEQAMLLGLNNREREIEAQILDITKMLREEEVILTQEQTDALREKIAALYDLNEVMMIQQGILDGTVGAREDFGRTLTAIENLMADPKSKFKKTDATDVLATEMPGMFDGTKEQMDAFVAYQQQMYDQIQMMRDRDLISEQTATQMRLKLAADEFEFRTQNFSTMFDALASLSQSGNKRLAAIGRAAAVTQATIDGILAVQKALASAPPPLNYAMAAAVGVAQAANVHRIMSQGFATGGSFTVGGSGGVDSQMVAFRASPGEQVEINRPQNVRHGDSSNSERSRSSSFNPTFVLPSSIPRPQLAQTQMQVAAAAYHGMQRAARRNGN